MSVRYLDAYGARRAVPLQTLPRILHHRTGGNPLFLMAMVDDLANRGMLVRTDEGWTLRDNSEAGDIPETIRQLVARQRERLQTEEQRILEAASVAGMEFSAAAVAAAVTTDTTTVEQRCEQLAERQQFLKRLGVEEWPDGTLAARYGFLHALYQHLWHERVSPTQLQQHHLQIGQRKERAYGERAQEIAAELAIHFEQGREYQRAVRYLQQAGENAVQRSANQEAVLYSTKGLELLKALPDTSGRSHQELRLQIALGTQLAAIKGWGALEAEKPYTRALELCRQVEETPQLFPVMAGLAAFYLVRGELQTARELAEQCFNLVQRMHNPARLVWPHCILAQISLWLGEFVLAREHQEQAIALYDPQKHGSYTFSGAYDPGVGSRCLTALTLWLQGYPDQALQKNEEALTLARELAHPFSLALALSFAAFLHQWCGERGLTQEQARAGITLSTEQGFAYWSAFGTIMEGWVLTAQGQTEEGIAQIFQGLTVRRAAGAEVNRSHFLGLLAEAHSKVGQIEEGLSVLAEAFVIVEKNGEHYYEAELYRLKGELLLAQARDQATGKSY